MYRNQTNKPTKYNKTQCRCKLNQFNTVYCAYWTEFPIVFHKISQELWIEYPKIESYESLQSATIYAKHSLYYYKFELIDVLPIK